MKIRDLKIIVVGNPWKNWAFIRLDTDEGITGYGECTGGLSTMPNVAAAEELRSRVIGRDPLNVSGLIDFLRKTLFLARGGNAVSGIEIACWDIIGKACGKRKLCPQISPHKTVEGLIGGLVSCILLNLLTGFCYEKICALTGVVVQIHYLRLILISPLASLISVLGDLSFSMIKRQFSIKDFGNIMPGHGGVLDRFDSVIFAAPVVWMIATAVGM